MAKKRLRDTTQQERIFLRHCRISGRKLTKEAKRNLFGNAKDYDPYFNYWTNRSER